MSEALESILNKDGGNVGIGTTSPSGTLEVTSERTTGDLVKINIDPSESGNPAGLHITNTDANLEETAAYFKITDQSGTHKVRVNKNGNVGIGTANPGQKLTVESGQEDYVAKLINTSADPAGLSIQLTADIANASNDFIRCFKNTSDIRFRVYSNGTVLANTTEYTSDDRVKHNEQNIVGAIETLGKLTPKKYIKTTDMYEADHDFELDADGNPVDADGEPVEHSIEAGVIAQQVLTVPELAFMVSPEGVDEDGNITSPHGLNYNSLFTYAIAAIQEQQSIIEDLKSRIETLESK